MQKPIQEAKYWCIFWFNLNETQDPMRGGRDDVLEDLVAIIHSGDIEAQARDATTPPRKRLVPECMLNLAGRICPLWRWPIYLNIGLMKNFQMLLCIFILPNAIFSAVIIHAYAFLLFIWFSFILFLGLIKLWEELNFGNEVKQFKEHPHLFKPIRSFLIFLMSDPRFFPAFLKQLL